MLEVIKKKLGVKIFLGLVAFQLVYAAGMLLYIHHTTTSRYKSERELYWTHGISVIRTFAQNGNVSLALLGENREIIAQEVELLYQDKTISYAVVYAANKNVLYADPRSQILVSAGESSAVGPPFPDLNNYRSAEEGEVFGQEFGAERGVFFLDLIKEVKLEGVSQGWIRLGLSQEMLVRQLRQARLAGWGLLAGFIVVGIVLVLLTLRRFMPPLHRLAEAARQISQGNFEVRLETVSEDELGLLTSTFNDMVTNIQEQTGQIQAMIDNIADAIQLLTSTTSELLVISSEQAAGATEQAAIVQEVVSTTEEFAATANRIADTARAVSEAATQSSDAARQGKQFMSEAIQGMLHIREQVEKGTAQIMELARQAQMIGGVIDIIEEISENTNLLSLNAAIEAAGAGEAGRRFGVVANEVRRLANNTLEAAASVRKMVDSIQSSTAAMVMLAENEQKAVVEGVEAMQRMGQYFGHILDMVETTRAAAAEIGLITQQQSSANQQMLTSIQDVEKVAREVELGVKKIESSVAEIGQLAERLTSLIGVSQKVEPFTAQSY